MDLLLLLVVVVPVVVITRIFKQNNIQKSMKNYKITVEIKSSE